MCTRVIWPDADGAVIVGRNMDFHKDLMTNLWKQPRGVERDDGVEGELTWTSKYGSVIATAFDIISVDGINEAGLAGHVLWLAESDYGTPDEGRTKLSQAIWMQYFLDNFATVAEAVEWIEKTDVQVVQMDDPTGGKPPAIHLALDDATGDSAHHRVRRRRAEGLPQPGLPGDDQLADLRPAARAGEEGRAASGETSRCPARNAGHRPLRPGLLLREPASSSRSRSSRRSRRCSA